ALRRLAGNLAVLAETDPHAAAQIAQAPDGPWGLDHVPGVGLMPLRYDGSDWGRSGGASGVASGGSCKGRPETGRDPVAATRQRLAQLQPAIDAGRAVTLVGLSDGLLLAELAQIPADRWQARPHQAIYAGEADWSRLKALLLAYDWTAPDAPLRSPRVLWFLGPGWPQRLLRRLKAEPELPPPTTSVRAADPQQTREYENATADYQALHESLVEQVNQLYAEPRTAALADLLGPNPPRRPRILLCVSRHTTVLQHSARAAQRAFDELGWNTHLFIEPSNIHQLGAVAHRSRLLEFQPDAVFMIDHLRREMGGCFPHNLPVFSWIQDELSHLTSAEAGRSVGERDFVLTPAGPYYAEQFDYPARQCVYAHKATEIGQAPPSLEPDPSTPDVVFVSHGAADPAHTAACLTEAHHNDPGFYRFAQALLDHYAQGGAIATLHGVRNLGGQALGVDPHAIPEAWTLQLHNRLNNLLYRQQAVAWAAQACQDLNLSLGLYGQGWDQRQAFAHLAQGPVGYGRPLQRLTASAKINLQILPFCCVHQRLLDGIAAGGFFLVRAHPQDDADHALRHALRHAACPWSWTYDDLRRALPDRLYTPIEQARRALEAAIDRPLAPQTPRVFPTWTRPPAAHGVPPRYADVRFDAFDSLKRAIERYAHDPAERAAIAAEQFSWVRERFSYTRTLERVVAAARARLREGIDTAPLDAFRAASLGLAA
ncbi:MAG: hypothetical protein AAGA57_09075, partial [Planctomycetota bacterium]